MPNQEYKRLKKIVEDIQESLVGSNPRNQIPRNN